MKRWALVVVGCSLLAGGPAEGIGLAVNAGQPVLIQEDARRAVIFYDHGHEELLVQAVFEGSDGPVCWVMAFPGRPTVSVAAVEALNNVSRIMAERGRLDGPPPVPGGCAGVLSYISFSPGDSLSQLTVVGPADTAGLDAWFERNRFASTGGGYASCKGEMDRGRWLVLVRTTPYAWRRQAGVVRGVIAGPLRIRFDVPDPVLPMGPSPDPSGPTSLTLFTLAGQPLVAANAAPDSWGHRFAPPGPLPPSLADDLPGTATGDFWISRLEAELDSAPAEGIRFAPYDPMTDFSRGDRRDQLDAIACLGLLGRRDAVKPLMARLDAGDPRQAEAAAAICALGRIGDRAALPLLLARAKSESWRVRRDALWALGLMGAREAYPLFIRGLTRRQENLVQRTANGMVRYVNHPGSDLAEGERLLCVRLLQEHGDSTCLGPLRGMLRDSVSQGDRWRPADHRPYTLAALAGLGDRDAYRSVLDELVRGSPVTRPDALAGAGGPFRFAGEIRGPILNGSPPSRWPAVTRVEERFAGAPAVRERLIREASRDAAVPDPGRALLVARLDRPTSADRDVLEAILDRALSHDDGSVVIGERRGAEEAGVLLDVGACAAVYALARLGETDRLLALWRSEAGERPGLRGELAYALAETGSPEALPALLEYVTRDWDAAFSDPNFAIALDRHRNRKPYDWIVALRAVDFDHRSREIREFVREAGGPEVLRRLAGDPALDPYSRLLWLLELTTAYARTYRVPDLNGTGLALLDRIAGPASGLPGGRELTEAVRAVLRGDLGGGG